jgi:hypothetical protein
LGPNGITPCPRSPNGGRGHRCREALQVVEAGERTEAALEECAPGDPQFPVLSELACEYAPLR